MAPKENIKKLMELNYIVVPVSAEAELALRMADKSKAISYIPGDSKFEIISDKLTKAQKKGLEKLQTLLKQYKGTGVQNCINAAALKLLDQMFFMSRLDKLVADVVSAIKRKYPELEIKITPPIEDEDVDLEVYAPKEKAREIHKFATKITYDIQLEEGYNIVVLVIPYPSA
ncbi:MAG: hypothetical protein ACE5J9_10830 [Methanosarcinales archaeon]